MIPYAPLRPGPGFAPVRAAAYYAQRCVVHPTIRRCVAHVLAAVVRGRQATISSQHEPEMRDAVAALERDGIAMMPALFSSSELEDVVEYFMRQPVTLQKGGRLALDQLPAGTVMAAYELPTVVACPGLMSALNRPGILHLASAYLGCKPTISAIGVRWSFPQATAPDMTQAFHRDPDEWRFLKLFIYLTDVDDGSGPHVFVSGSHKTSGRLRGKAYSEAQVEGRFGRQNIRTVLGDRGTTFVADTIGIHAGMPPRQAPRLLLQAQYSILPNFALQYRPVAAPSDRELDPYVNRLIMRQPRA